MSSIIQSFREGKYTVIFHEESGKMEAFHDGKPWQDLTDNGLILTMLQDYDFLEEQSRLADMQVDCLLNEVEYLKDQITRLENKNETLENNVDTLENKIEQIEAESAGDNW